MGRLSINPPIKKELPGSSEEWLAHAKSDLALARLARGRTDILSAQVCFHAQQAAEKALKAVLLARQAAFPLTHDIEELLELAQAAGIPLTDELREAAFLSPYAVETRYPGSWEAIGSMDVDEAIGRAEKVVGWAVNLVSPR